MKRRNEEMLRRTSWWKWKMETFTVPPVMRTHTCIRHTLHTVRYNTSTVTPIQIQQQHNMTQYAKMFWQNHTNTTLDFYIDKAKMKTHTQTHIQITYTCNHSKCKTHTKPQHNAHSYGSKLLWYHAQHCDLIILCRID